MDLLHRLAPLIVGLTALALRCLPAAVVFLVWCHERLGVHWFAPERSRPPRRRVGGRS
jgi:hypothetical protein